jgi:hypothetical protein
MRSSTRSFIKRVAKGGVIVGGAAFIGGGCAVIGEADGEEKELQQTAASAVIMCHVNPSNGSFADVMVDGDSVAQRLADGDTIGTCAALFCGDS